LLLMKVAGRSICSCSSRWCLAGCKCEAGNQLHYRH
jgi:hypothetical protein